MTSKKRGSVFISAITGNVLEYYDFTIYSIFSYDIGKIFFPNLSEFLQLISSLSVFAIGFLSRPIGGILFGTIADRFGRRKSLIISMIGMTISTILIGLIPGYNEIGVTATLMLCFLRLLQGLCLSGEGTGVAIFVLEHYSLRPGFAVGLVHGSNLAGTMISSFVGIIIKEYCTDANFAWRLAFLLGGFFGIFGFYIRLKTIETPIFQEIVRNRSVSSDSFYNVILKNRVKIIITVLSAGFASSLMYIVKGYIHIFYTNIRGVSVNISLLYLLYSSFVIMISMPIFGIIVDRIGRYAMIKRLCIFSIVFITPIFYLVFSTESKYFRVLGLTIFGLLTSGIATSAYIFVISLFEPKNRALNVGFGYNLGVALFGGTSPIISRWLLEYSNMYFSPAIYVICTSTLFLITIHCFEEDIKQ